MKTDTHTQQTFKALMQAMSRPGTVHRLSVGSGDWPLMPVLLTLLDNEVTFATVGPDIDGEALAIATGSKETTVEEADYVVVSGGSGARSVLRAKRGDLRYPDRSATMLYQVASLEGTGLKLLLRGPGIEGEKTLAIDGFTEGEVRAIREANAGFPLGVDCIFVDALARAAAVPRSTRMEVV